MSLTDLDSEKMLLYSNKIGLNKTNPYFRDQKKFPQLKQISYLTLFS